MARLTGLPALTGPLLDLVVRKQSSMDIPRRSARERLLARSRAAQTGAGGYGAAALAREADDVLRAQKGQRNHALNRAAFNCFQLVAAEQLDIAEVQETLSSAARSIGLGDDEILQTLRSAAEGAERAPRAANRLPSERLHNLSESSDNAAERPQLAPSSELPDVDPDTGEMVTDPAAEFRANIRTTEEMEAYEPPAWLVDGIMFQGGFGALYGHPGTLKSFLAIDIAMCVATGNWWKGKPTAAGRVLYVVAEGKGGAGRRIHAWREHNRWDREANIDWYDEAGDLLNDVWLAQLAAYLRETQPLLMVVDTLARSMPGGEENEGKDMSRIVQNLDACRKGLNVAVLLVHHSPKIGGGLRGHSSLHGAMDTEIEMRRDTHSVTMHCAKQKDAEEFHDIQLWWQKMERSIVLTTAPQAVDEDVTDRYAEQVWQCLRANYRHTGANYGTLERDLTMSTSEVSRGINRLLDHGRVVKEGTSWRALHVFHPDDDQSNPSNAAAAARSPA